jgi:hypothetical protein
MSKSWSLLVFVSLKYCAEKMLLKTHVAFFYESNCILFLFNIFLTKIVLYKKMFKKNTFYTERTSNDWYFVTNFKGYLIIYFWLKINKNRLITQWYCVWIVFLVGPGTYKSALKSGQFFQGYHHWIGHRKLIRIDIQLDGIVCL